MIPPIANRFVAGETAAEAIERVRNLNDRGVGAILNRLGEHYHDRELADDDTEAYCRLIDDIASGEWRGCISVKPSQLGLSVGTDVFRGNVDRIAERAAAKEVFVWVDMEEYAAVDPTLTVYEPLARSYPGSLGVCVQANLERTRADVERLVDVPGKIRVVKGAYDPPAGEGYRDQTRVTDAYESLLEWLFREYTGTVAVATHDRHLIDYAIECHGKYGGAFEFQMLMGVREELQFTLTEEYPVWQYVPFGEKWMSYFYRRVMERKENAVFALRAVVESVT